MIEQLKALERRIEVMREVSEERQNQDQAHGGPGRDDLHSPNDWVAICTGTSALLLGMRGQWT